VILNNAFNNTLYDLSLPTPSSFARHLIIVDRDELSELI